MSIKKNDPRIIKGWVMYDWANSVYSLSIATAIFPIFFVQVIKGDTVNFLGIDFKDSALYSYCVSFAFLLVALVSPLLSGIADYKGNKKGFMKFFVYLGSLSCITLAFFNGDNIYLGVFPFVAATFAFAGSLVFYNAYLHEIVTPDRMDSVSARGFSMGYIGSVILLIVNLLVIQKPEWFGIDPNNGSLPSQIAFITVGLWWAGFAQITFRLLPPSENKHPYSKKLLTQGYRELKKVWGELKTLGNLKKFLVAFFVYSMALQTIMYVASVFGEKELKLETGALITAILIIQLVGVVGAWLFSRLSAKYGNTTSLAITLVIWVCVCVGAYFLPEKNYGGFYALGAAVGLVMGGSQSLSRSTYSKLLPATEDHTSFFSFYDVTEKLSIVMGTFVWGLLDTLFGNMRVGIVALVVFFVLGLALLRTVKDVKLKPLKA